MINIQLPDGKVLSVERGSSVYDVAMSIASGLAKRALCGAVDGQLVDLNYKLEKDAQVKIITGDDAEGKEVYRHSASHLMAQAVRHLFPGVKVTIGPAIENGFYYDFDLDHSFSDEDLVKIEAEIQRIVKEDIPVTRHEMGKEEAIAFFEKKGETYKMEIIRDIEADHVSVYTQGDFADLCRGPHVKSTGILKNVKLLSVAGAYWRGDEKNKMLQRIYATAFPKKEELDEYINRLEEAKKRDHRKIGKDMGLYSIHEEAGPGLIYWHPKGARIRVAIENFWRDEHYKNGYEQLFTPHMGKSWLWETSGHLSFYKDSMYSEMEVDEQDYYIKPMNCPFHIMIYKSDTHSYRDLPLRWAELGTVYRYERSGALHGLLRVRGFTQDDAHIICTPEQIDDEISEVLRFSLYMWRVFGFTDIKAYLSTKPKEKSVGEESRWLQAQESLQKAIEREGLQFEVDDGGGAFYGPKIDLKVKDTLGREWQMTTIQFDFNLPERFDMTYVDADGKEKRPYMVHRALLGSIERFFGVLIENYAGAFPIWLHPVQAIILPISDKFNDYALSVQKAMKTAGIRADVDLRNEKVGYKIREAQVKEKIPYMLVVGEKEMNDGTVAVRTRKGEDLGAQPTADFINKVLEDIREKR